MDSKGLIPKIIKIAESSSQETATLLYSTDDIKTLLAAGNNILTHNDLPIHINVLDDGSISWLEYNGVDDFYSFVASDNAANDEITSTVKSFGSTEQTVVDVPADVEKIKADLYGVTAAITSTITSNGSFTYTVDDTSITSLSVGDIFQATNADSFYGLQVGETLYYLQPSLEMSADDLCQITSIDGTNITVGKIYSLTTTESIFPLKSDLVKNYVQKSEIYEAPSLPMMTSDGSFTYTVEDASVTSISVGDYFCARNADACYGITVGGTNYLVSDGSRLYLNADNIVQITSVSGTHITIKKVSSDSIPELSDEPKFVTTSTYKALVARVAELESQLAGLNTLLEQING